MKRKPFAITLDPGSSLANHTGSWRTVRPEYVDRLPPCNHACPAGENIQAWLYEAESGGEGYERAWRKLAEDMNVSYKVAGAAADLNEIRGHDCGLGCF